MHRVGSRLRHCARTGRPELDLQSTDEQRAAAEKEYAKRRTSVLAALMRYHLLVTRGDGETPENLLTSDRFLLAAGGLWVVCAGSAIYLA